ncbi:MAG: redoxin domain-containing protein [Pirellulales bacterium]
MTTCRAFSLLFAALTVFVLPAGAATPSPTTIDVRFLKPLDLAGKPVALVENESRAGTALVFISPECPISRQYIPELKRLAASPATENVAFYGVLSDRTVSRAAAVKFAEEFKIDFRIAFDATGELAELLQPTHVPQAFLLDAQGKVVYRGRIDDLYAAVDKRRGEATTHDLLAAMTALANGTPNETASTTPIGCLFEPASNTPKPSEITYTRDIAPLLNANCVECHRPGEVAPFSLLGYEDAAKRAKWLSEVTRDGLMPPWRAELGHEAFLDERRLTAKEIELFAAWADAGAPKGDEADLPPQPVFPTGWRLGEPDVVVEAPTTVTVPADGPDIFHHWVMPIDIPEDKVLVGIEFRPGNPSVVHHAIIGLDTTGGSRRRDEATPEPGYRSSGSIEGSMNAFLGVWTPGMTPRFYPENVGFRIPQKADILLQLHLHPSGKEELDQSRVALYFADKPPQDMKTQSMFVTGTLVVDIPPGESRHHVHTSVTLPVDLTLNSVFPHLHLIGKEAKVVAHLPGGEDRTLIWIKDWNFYWQDVYVFKDPVQLPKGTQIDIDAWYDNSAENPFNPSRPPKQVLFGNDSDDEMCFMLFQTVHDDQNLMSRLAPAMMMSFMREWREADLAPEAREHIVEEAMKLFGGGGGRGRGGDMLRRLLSPESKPQRGDKQEAERDAEPGATKPSDGEANATEPSDGEANATEPSDGEANAG